MSLSDHLRYLRAMSGGPDTDSIATALGLESPQSINKAETLYRPIKDVALIDQLAAYYGRPAAEFHWHNARPRKYLTFSAEASRRTQSPLSLTLRTGEVVTGTAAWWDLSSIGLTQADGRLLVIQRHAVIDWPGATDWEDV
ncbi:MAG: hypothetical protein IAE79_16720 [Anaerolinea sp.]|nr:hypothetical protein [Anaerolinea sp.]